jgi:hypothetical protein
MVNFKMAEGHNVVFKQKSSQKAFYCVDCAYDNAKACSRCGVWTDKDINHTCREDTNFGPANPYCQKVVPSQKLPQCASTNCSCPPPYGFSEAGNRICLTYGPAKWSEETK